MKRKYTKQKKEDKNTDFTSFVNKEVKEWEEKHGKVKYTPEYCKINNVTEERNKIK